jgi:hypothetical protein
LTAARRFSTRLTSYPGRLCSRVVSILCLSICALLPLIADIVPSSFSKLDGPQPPTLPRHQAHQHHSSASALPQLPSPSATSCASALRSIYHSAAPSRERQLLPRLSSQSTPTWHITTTFHSYRVISSHPHATPIKQPRPHRGPTCSFQVLLGPRCLITTSSRHSGRHISSEPTINSLP